MLEGGDKTPEQIENTMENKWDKEMKQMRKKMNPMNKENNFKKDEDLVKK